MTETLTHRIATAAKTARGLLESLAALAAEAQRAEADALAGEPRRKVFRVRSLLGFAQHDAEHGVLDYLVEALEILGGEMTETQEPAPAPDERPATPAWAAFRPDGTLFYAAIWPSEDTAWDGLRDRTHNMNQHLRDEGWTVRRVRIVEEPE